MRSYIQSQIKLSARFKYPGLCSFVPLLLCALLLAPCSLLTAQDIVPHRDIQIVDSLNRGKPQQAPVTVNKGGYFQVTRDDGRSYWARVEAYLIDSTSLPFAGQDTAYINAGDSLVIITSDLDTVYYTRDVSLSAWLEHTTDDPPGINDTIYHAGTVTIGPDSAYTGLLNMGGRFDIRFPDWSGTNIAIGKNALVLGTTTLNNFACGENVLSHVTSADYNVGLGNGALESMTTGDYNTAIGANVMNLAVGGGATQNTAIGDRAVANGLITANNTVIGSRAGYSGMTSFNTIIGSQAGFTTHGSSNTFIGRQAGYLTTGSGNVMIGASAGYNETGSNKLYIDNSNTTTPLIKGDFSANSLVVNGTLGYTTDAGACEWIAGLDINRNLRRMYVGPGLSLLDNTLSVATTGQDSVFSSGDSICVVDILGDTVCISQDSFYMTDTSVCYIVMGDTSCVTFSSTGALFYLADGAFSSNRTVGFNSHFLKLTHGFNQGQILFNQTGVYPLMSIMGQVVPSNTSPLFELTHSSFYDLYMRFNGSAAEDYSFGVNKLQDALYISGGDDLTIDPMMYFSHTRDSIIVYKDIQLDAGLLDGGGDIGGSGQVLTTTGTETNWVSGSALNIPISSLDPALGSNTIANGSYAQEWQWDLLGANSALLLSSNSTTAASNLQKMLEVKLYGANATSSQSTYAGYFSNTHTGTGAANYGIYAAGTGGSSGYGLWATGTTAGAYGLGFYGLHGETTSANTASTALRGNATAGIGLYTRTTTGLPLYGSMDSGSSGISSLLNLVKFQSGSASTGVGGSIDFFIETAAGTADSTTSLISRWIDKTYATRTSQFKIRGWGAGTAYDILSIEGDRRILYNGRSEEQQGADIASVAGAIALGYDGNTFEITGTNAITLISNIGWQNGSTVTLMFSSTASLVHGTASSGTDITIKLDGGTNFNATADDTITLKLGEIGGVQAWRQVSRSIN